MEAPRTTAPGALAILELAQDAGAAVPEILARRPILRYDGGNLGLDGPWRDAAELLGFTAVINADLQLSNLGREWTEADILTSKSVFGATARERAPIVRAIVRALDASHDGTLHEQFFLDMLARGFGEDEARAQLGTAIGWGRYGELFDLRREYR